MADRAGKPAAKSAEDVERDRLSAQGQTHGAADAPGPGSDEVQAAMDEATAKGFFGVEIDSTPNEHYTVDGVTSGKPTPETDADAHDAAYVSRNPHRTK
jgi:hypothetical protein